MQAPCWYETSNSWSVQHLSGTWHCGNKTKKLIEKAKGLLLTSWFLAESPAGCSANFLIFHSAAQAGREIY